MLNWLRFLTCLVAWSLCFPYSSCAFDTPLSDTAVRDAYFLGQHRDQTMAEFLSKYTKQLPIPATGPYINYKCQSKRMVDRLNPPPGVTSPHLIGKILRQRNLDEIWKTISVKLSGAVRSLLVQL